VTAKQYRYTPEAEPGGLAIGGERPQDEAVKDQRSVAGLRVQHVGAVAMWPALGAGELEQSPAMGQDPDDA
jgi:hypothetical protein